MSEHQHGIGGQISCCALGRAQWTFDAECQKCLCVTFVKSNKTHLNIAYCNEPIKEVYHKLFDEALEKYNAKQTRNERKIADYYEKIRTGKQEKLFHEIIIQVGNCDDMSATGENAALPVCNREAKRKSATSAEIGKTGDTVLTVEKRNFPFLTPKIVSHIKKAFSIGKSAFFHALDRAFLSEKSLTSKTL